MTLSLDHPRTPLAKLLAYAETRAPQSLAPFLAQARRDVAVVEGRILLGDRPSPLLYDRKPEPPAQAPRAVVAAPIAAAVAPATAPVATPSPAPKAKNPSLSVVTIEDLGATHRVPVARTQYLLEAALNSNVNIPFSCTLGGCGTCKVELLEGEMELEEPNCLTPEELAAGYRLSCVGRIVSSECRVRIHREE